jgi:hypothetical protein
MNQLNYFNTFGTAGPAPAPSAWAAASTDCRGADRRRRVRPAVAQDGGRRSSRSNADVLGVNEIENDGYGPTARWQTSSTSSTRRPRRAPTPTSTPTPHRADQRPRHRRDQGRHDLQAGQGHPGRARRRRSTPSAFVNGGDGAPQPRLAGPGLPGGRHRRRFIVNVNHLKSKGSACDAPDAGDGQGNCNASAPSRPSVGRGWPPTPPGRATPTSPPRRLQLLRHGGPDHRSRAPGTPT